jgi:hypothetical protein
MAPRRQQASLYAPARLTRGRVQCSRRAERDTCIRTDRDGKMCAVDWATVISNGITGFVGIAGIAGSIVSASMASKSAAQNLQTSIAAEDARAKQAEKRRVYGALLAAIGRYVGAQVEMSRFGGGPGTERALTRFTSAEVEATNATSEVQLIAPKELGDHAIKVLRIVERAGPSEQDQTLADALALLTSMMRDDLGELVPATGTAETS